MDRPGGSHGLPSHAFLFAKAGAVLPVGARVLPPGARQTVFPEDPSVPHLVEKRGKGGDGPDERDDRPRPVHFPPVQRGNRNRGHGVPACIPLGAGHLFGGGFVSVHDAPPLFRGGVPDGATGPAKERESVFRGGRAVLPDAVDPLPDGPGRNGRVGGGGGGLPRVVVGRGSRGRKVFRVRSVPLGFVVIWPCAAQRF